MEGGIVLNAYLLLNIPASIIPEEEILTYRGESRTYSRLLEETGLLAGALAARGVRQGDRVGLISTNRPEMIAAFYAAFQLGAVIVPINYRAKAEELSYMLGDAGVTALLIENRYAGLVETILPETDVTSVICLDGPHSIGPGYGEAIQQIGEPLADFADVEPEELSILLYTSGTTSKPKGVMITYGQLTTYVMNHSEAADGTPKGASIICAPSYHVAGATSICNCIYGGRRLILLNQFEAGSWLRAIEKEKATHGFLIPTMLKQVLDHPNFGSTDLSSLESLSYGAAPMPFPIIRRAIEAFPTTTNFANAFGLTETTSTVCVLGPEDHKLTGTPEEIEKKTKRLKSVGCPLPGVEVAILDDHGNELGRNEVGSVFVRTNRSMKGYWKRPDASSETIQDGWINTKDMGWIDEDGYLFLSGRSSDMIIRAGENISPAEIEDVLHGHPDVSDVAVISSPSLEWGEEVMAVIVPAEYGSPPAEDELIAYCRRHLASFKCPAIIHFVEELPRTTTGKILKRTLRDQFVQTG